VIGKCWPRHRAVEFRKFLNQIDRDVPAHLTVHLVLDNYATHKTKEIRAWFLRRPRYHLHFTPTHSSWLNQVARWFALLSQRQIKRGSRSSVRELESAIFGVHRRSQRAAQTFCVDEECRCASQQHWTVRFPHSGCALHNQYARNQRLRRLVKIRNRKKGGVSRNAGVAFRGSKEEFCRDALARPGSAATRSTSGLL